MHWAQLGGGGSKRETWARAFTVVSAGGQGRAGKADLGLADWNNVKRQQVQVYGCL